jgi:hypothetical protein
MKEMFNMRLFEYERSRTELEMFKSMDIDTLKAAGVDVDEIEKAMAREGLTQKEVQVTKDGKTFTRRQWVRTGNDNVGSGDAERPHKHLSDKELDDNIKRHQRMKDEKDPNYHQRTHESLKEEKAHREKAAADNKPKAEAKPKESPKADLDDRPHKHLSDKELDDAIRRQKNMKAEGNPNYHQRTHESLMEEKKHRSK